LRVWFDWWGEVRYELANTTHSRRRRRRRLEGRARFERASDAQVGNLSFGEPKLVSKIRLNFSLPGTAVARRWARRGRRGREGGGAGIRLLLRHPARRGGGVVKLPRSAMEEAKRQTRRRLGARMRRLSSSPEIARMLLRACRPLSISTRLGVSCFPRLAVPHPSISVPRLKIAFLSTQVSAASNVALALSACSPTFSLQSTPPSPAPPIPPPKPDAYENIYTIPNALTLTRICACPVIGYYVLQGELGKATALLFVAGVTDLVRGVADGGIG
jgi:hypothetical protein